MVRLNIPLDPAKTGRDAVSLENNLRRMIVGQDEAIQQIVNMYQMSLTGMSVPGRPIGNLLLLGPTGSGKTRIVEATAEALLKNPRVLIKIDCAEFQHSHEIAKLIGSPPGYLGHKETHPLLSQETIDQHHTQTTKISFVLFDEIEKASDALWQLMLGILDKGTLTLGDNRRVDLSRCVIFMTSNLGAVEMSDMLQGGGIGFTTGRHNDIGAINALDNKLYRTALEVAKRKFSPEFMNRIDKVVVFRALNGEDLEQILDIELREVQERIIVSQTSRQFAFNCTDESKAFLLREGTDFKYGARHLKRAIERHLVFPLSNLIATGQINQADIIRVDLNSEGDKLTFCRERAMPTFDTETPSMVGFANRKATKAVRVGASESQAVAIDRLRKA